MTRHLLTLFDLSGDEINRLLARARWLKAERLAGRRHLPLAGKALAMIFEKPSTRTRVSFEVAMYQLGGHALYLSAEGSQLGRGETYADTARVLSRMVDGIMVRTFEQDRIAALAAAATVPVINGLTDLSHPCQILADLVTVMEERGTLEGCRICYVGDGNNVCNSWIEAAVQLGFTLAVATPPGFEPAAVLRERIARDGHRHIMLGDDPRVAVAGSHVVNTDTWVSMGQEGEDLERKRAVFAPFQVNRRLMQHAAPDAIVLHCLPAHRGEEITDEVMDGPQSRVFDQAENRLHAQKALLEMLLG
ncbi:MAG: ornithine carbamoyltransferase [Deltaproteobacteria bacterium]|nr:ornithine carbamoyltransferase [Deltaproteobacteria bacterium]